MTNAPMIFDIQRGSYVDGPGVRTVVFFKGCNLDCAWCHNPESKAAAPQILYYRNRCTSCGECRAVCPAGAIGADFSVDNSLCVRCGKCAEACMPEAKTLCGAPFDLEEIVATAKKDLTYYCATGGGVTLSGGECMLYPDAVAELERRFLDAGITTALDTAGNVPREHFDKVLPTTNLFLYDLKHADAERHRRFTGADNARILANLDYLAAVAPEKVIVRIPVIPGFNADDESLRAIRGWLDARPSLTRVEPLKYHSMGDSKAPAAGLPVFSAPPLSDEEFSRIKAFLTGEGDL